MKRLNYSTRLVKTGALGALERLGGRHRHLALVYSVLHDAIWRDGSRRQGDRTFQALWRGGKGHVISVVSVPEIEATSQLCRTLVYEALGALHRLKWIYDHGDGYFALADSADEPLYVEEWLERVEKAQARLGNGTSAVTRQERTTVALGVLQKELGLRVVRSGGRTSPQARTKPSAGTDGKFGLSEGKTQIGAEESDAQIFPPIQIPSSPTVVGEEVRNRSTRTEHGDDARALQASPPGIESPSCSSAQPLKESSAPTPLPSEPAVEAAYRAAFGVKLTRKEIARLCTESGVSPSELPGVIARAGKVWRQVHARWIVDNPSIERPRAGAFLLGLSEVLTTAEPVTDYFDGKGDPNLQRLLDKQKAVAAKVAAKNAK